MKNIILICVIVIILLILVSLFMSLDVKIYNGGKKNDELTLHENDMLPFSDMYDNLKNENFIWEKENDIEFLNRTIDDYYKMDSISEHFVGVECIKTYKGSKQSPLMVHKNKYSSSDKKIKYVTHIGNRECEVFNVGLAIALYRRYGGGKVLDCFTEFGNKLIAAFAAEVTEYIGYYNDLQHIGCLCETGLQYQKIYHSCVSECKLLNNVTSADIIYGERQLINKNYFDIAIFAPPFYDREFYFDNDINISKFSSDTWINSFYKPILQSNIDALKTGGFLILYIEPFLEHMTESYLSDKMKFKEQLGFRQIINSFGKVHHIIVWQKS